jgi:hypothetical protein
MDRQHWTLQARVTRASSANTTCTQVYHGPFVIAPTTNSADCMTSRHELEEPRDSRDYVAVAYRSTLIYVALDCRIAWSSSAVQFKQNSIDRLSKAKQKLLD